MMAIERAKVNLTRGAEKIRAVEQAACVRRVEVLDDGEMREIEIQAQDFPCFLLVKLGNLPCLLGRLRAGVAVGFQIQRQSQVGGLLLHRDPQVHGFFGLHGVVAKLHIDSDRV
jgi:hypothetical protein